MTNSHDLSHPSAIQSTEESKVVHRPSAVTVTCDTPQINRENILFVYLDLHSQLHPQKITTLRAINDYVQTYADESICFNFLQTSTDRIFFICPTNDKELIRAVHDLNGVEAMFLLSSDLQIDRSRLPKVELVCNSFEELLVGLRNTMEWFEDTQLDLFAFERDRIFLWTQLWKQEV